MSGVCAGQKFPSKSLEVSVQATLHFPEYPPPAPPEVNEDPFCVGLNSYADVSLTPHKHSISICMLLVSCIGPSLVSFLASFPDHLQRKRVLNYSIHDLQVFFKIPDFTASGCNVDGRSITLFPNAKYRLSVGKRSSNECQVVFLAQVYTFNDNFDLFSSKRAMLGAIQNLELTWRRYCCIFSIKDYILTIA